VALTACAIAGGTRWRAPALCRRYLRTTAARLRCRYCCLSARADSAAAENFSRALQVAAANGGCCGSDRHGSCLSTCRSRFLWLDSATHHRYHASRTFTFNTGWRGVALTRTVLTPAFCSFATRVWALKSATRCASARLQHAVATACCGQLVAFIRHRWTVWAP